MSDNNPNQREASQELVIFLSYLEILAKQKKRIITVTSVSFVLAVTVAFALPKVYSATARILPPQQDPGLAAIMMGQLGGGAGGLTSLAGSVLGAGTPADQYASILTSERMKDVIIDRFKLLQEYDKDYRVDMYDKMDKLVEVKAGKKDGIIAITVEDEDPQKCAAIANAYVDEIGKLAAELSMTSGGSNRAFLEGRLVKAKADLSQAEDALKAFQTKNKAVNVPAQAQASLEGVAQLMTQIAAAEAQLSGLRSQVTDSAQEVQVLKATIRDLRGKLATLEGTGAGSIPSVGSIPSLGQEQLRLLRNFKTQEMLVELLTKQNELAKLTEAKNVNTVQVIQKATPPDKKVKPKRILIVVGVTFFGMILSSLWVLFQNFRENLSPHELAMWRKVKAALVSR
jgi:tyrosine-protein kinase Etk/Wzc